jgi:hypothetical protein
MTLTMPLECGFVIDTAWQLVDLRKKKLLSILVAGKSPPLEN